MRVRPPAAAALARLLAWDAPFLPLVGSVAGEPDRPAVVCSAPGCGLDTVMRWPRAARAAVTLQATAAAAFLFERGWYPSRGLLRGGRVERRDGAPWYRLARLPALRLDDAALERRLRRALVSEETVLVPVLLPLLKALLPEFAGELERALVERPAWEAVGAWLAALLERSRGATALRHPAGQGRALWARRLAVPARGVHALDDDSALAAVETAARLATLGDAVDVCAGALEEEDVARAQARAAAVGRDALVVTTLALPGVAGVGIDGSGDGVWVLAPWPELAHAHAAAALDGGDRRPVLVRAALEVGAATGFATPPGPPAAARERAALASTDARRTLTWLEASPVGLAPDDLALLADGAAVAVVELERLGLARMRRGAWHALRPSETPTAGRVAAIAERLPAGSVAGLFARAVARGEACALAERCEALLESGDAHAVLDVARAAPALLPIRLAGAEAALRLGRLRDAERFLDAIPGAARGGLWHALAAWRAEEASASAQAATEIAAVSGALPGRVAARCELVAAHAARRRGDRDALRRHLERAVALASPPPIEAEIGVAQLAGPAALRALRRSRAAVWSGDDLARALHATGLAALDRGCSSAAMTALRAALRAASGDDPHALGEIHADLACAAILADHPGTAERHLMLAEGLLERCGSLRAATVVRANRAVLANDRLDWRSGRDLTLAGRRQRGEVDDAGTMLFELELARADLARGDVHAVERDLGRLAEGARRFPEHPVVRQALAGVRAHVALALGDLAGAEVAARGAEDGERALVASVAAAEGGADPPAGLTRRWGLALTARFLAAWRRGDEAEALARVEHALRHWPREAAVGVARFAALLARRGERLGPAWEPHERAAEAALAEAELEGWARLLRGALGLDPARIVRALDGVVNAGTDGLGPARLEALARALDLDWLTVERGGTALAAWGEPSGESEETGASDVRVRTARGISAPARAALAMVARHVAGRADGGEPEAEAGAGDMLGVSAALAEVRRQVARWAPLPLTVLVTGEPGTGKELVAREIHASSGRRGAFLPVNCAGIPASLLEAELFGVTRGAFTGADRDRPGLVEAAENGTLFLDEIGELPLELQGKLLRLLQEREVRRVGATRSRTVDVRFVAATNRDLREDAAAGRFRRDLYYRLAVAVVNVPPLRERPEDVDGLAAHFAARFAALLGRPGVRLAPAALALLRGAAWPGNVRELESAVARAVAGARPGEVVGPERFPDLAPSPACEAPLPTWPSALEAFRRRYFETALREAGGNRSQAARRAGVSRQTFLYHLKELEIQGGDVDLEVPTPSLEVGRGEARRAVAPSRGTKKGGGLGSPP